MHAWTLIHGNFRSFLTISELGVEEPFELPEEPEQSDGPSVPFRLTEAKLGHESIGDQPYFGRLNTKVHRMQPDQHLLDPANGFAVSDVLLHEK